MNDVRNNGRNAIVIWAAIIVVIYGMQMAKVLLVPFLIATFLAMITVRPMLWLQQKRIPSFLAAMIIVFSIILILAAIGSILGNSIADFTAAIPGYQARLDAMVQGSFQFVAEYFDVNESLESLRGMIDPGWAMGLVANILNSLKDVLTNTFLIIFAMIFILLDASSFGTKVYAVVSAWEDTTDAIPASTGTRSISIKTAGSTYIRVTCQDAADSSQIDVVDSGMIEIRIYS